MIWTAQTLPSLENWVLFVSGITNRAVEWNLYTKDSNDRPIDVQEPLVARMWLDDPTRGLLDSRVRWHFVCDDLLIFREY